MGSMALSALIPQLFAADGLSQLDTDLSRGDCKTSEGRDRLIS
jgi:hypothetical protein